MNKYIWKCVYCGEEFDYNKGYKEGNVLCPECKSDDTGFHYEQDENGILIEE